MEQKLRRLPDGTYTGAMTDEHICGIFGCCGDWNRREVRIGALTVYVYAIDGITSGGDASEYVVKPLMQDAFGGTMDELYDRALHRTVYNSVAVPCGDLQSTAEKLVNGFTVVLFGQRAIAFETKTGEKRSPSAPEVENTVKGPKDAFTETVRTNTSLLRRHLRTPALRLYETVVGQRSLTNVTLAWIDGLTEPALVSRMQARLAEIDIDGLLTPAAVEEYLTGSRPTAFPLLQYTERTDRFAQALLEGRAGLLVDGLPLGYLAPVDLGYLMTSAEDRGTDFVSASFLRVLRYAALLLGLLLPGLYVAMAAFHPQMLPTELLQSILESKRAVPFPTIVEVLGLLAAFELLQEASVSLPQSVGQSLSIIGGLVVGSAAVEARLISPAALIVVAAAGICGFAIPGRSFADALRVWRMALAAAASLAGLFGLTLGAICLVVHLAGLESFGISYLAPFSGVGGARPAAATPRAGTAARSAAPAARPAQSGGEAMKWTLLAAAALVLCCGLPFRTHETRTLLPVQTVQAERTEAGVRIVTEAGEGSGATWDDAVAALRMAAPGEVYFDTAGQVVLCGKTDRLVNELLESGILRPAAQVRRSGGLTDPEGLFDLLEAHASPVTVGLLRAEPGTALPDWEESHAG